MAGVVCATTGLGLCVEGIAMAVSSPDWNRLPGRYLVSADFRSQDSQTLAAVDWAATHLPHGNTVAADRVPAVLLGSQARLWPITRPKRGLVPAQLYFSRVWGPQQTAIVKGLHIDYVYVDTRLADSLPYLGYYISQGETKKPTRLTEADVAKFDHVAGLKAIYHHGPVTIYDTAGLGVDPRWGGFRGHQVMGLGPLDAIVGAAVVLLVLRFRRRLAWVGFAIRVMGVLATTLVVMATTIFVGGLLFAARLMPGPAFTVGVLVTIVASSVVRTKVLGGRYLPRLPARRRWDPRVLLQPIVLLGIGAGASGLALAVHAAWITDVVKVNAILQTVR